jgi:hypothetical protein
MLVRVSWGLKFGVSLELGVWDLELHWGWVTRDESDRGFVSLSSGRVVRVDLHYEDLF